MTSCLSRVLAKCFLSLRSHTILNNIDKAVDQLPVVMFFPGQYNGQTLMLFNELKDDNHYRAFHWWIIDRGRIMEIRKMFEKPIDRDIRGVIKIGNEG